MEIGNEMVETRLTVNALKAAGFFAALVVGLLLVGLAVLGRILMKIHAGV